MFSSLCIPTLNFGNCLFHARSEGALKKVDKGYLFEVFSPSTALRSLPSAGGLELTDLFQQGSIVTGPCFTELIFDLSNGQVITGLNLENRRLALEATDRCRQPFETFQMLISVGEHIPGVAKGDGPDLLQLPPNLHSLAGFACWQRE